MDELLARIVDGEAVSLSEMEREGLKHVFMEVMELFRVEENVCSDKDSRFRRLLVAQATILAGFPHDKRAPFLEDALSMLLRKTQPMSPTFDDTAVDVIHGLLMAVQFPDDADTTPVILRQSKCIVKCVLTILGSNIERLTGSSPPPQPLLEMSLASLSRSGIPLEHIILFAKWKIFRSEWMAIVLPSASTDAASDDDEDEDDSDDEAAAIRQDVVRTTDHMLSTLLPDPFGLKYLGAPSWSDAGLAVVTYWLAVDTSLRSHLATPLAPDALALHPVAPCIETLLHHNSVAVKRGGITLLAAILQSSSTLPDTTDVSVGGASTDKASGLDTFAKYRLADRMASVTPLLQGVLSAIVMLPDAPDRANGLAAWQRLVDLVPPPSRQVLQLRHGAMTDGSNSCRIDLLAHLARTCPFPNGAAMIVDRVRGEIAKQWTPTSTSLHSKVVPFLSDMLRPRPDIEFVRHSDAVVSALSLLRFLLLRDKATRVLDLSALQPLLEGQWRRLQHLAATQASLEKSRRELHPTGPATLTTCGNVLSMTIAPSAAAPADPNGPVEYDLMRLFVMDAAFEAAMDAFR